MSQRQTVLVTGASGYLGQFLAQALAQEHKVLCQFHQNAPGGDGVPVKCDLREESEVEELFAKHGPIEAVVNAAAVSQPAVAQQNPEAIRRINVPSALLTALEHQRSTGGAEALLVHVSTDQVYHGNGKLWREGDATDPVNEYGRSKLEAEAAVRARWPRHCILRSSIILGPQAPVPVQRPLFLQFIDNALQDCKPVKFFVDEFRSPVFVDDIVKVVKWLLSQEGTVGVCETFNMGGRDRLSRADMARMVAEYRGRDLGHVEFVPSLTVQRAAPSPLDISMDSTLLQSKVPFEFKSFRAVLEAVL